jgi:hypothetical protein
MLKMLQGPEKIKVRKGMSTLNLNIPGQAVSLIKLEW